MITTPFSKILVTRTDRLGDVLLSTPIARIIKAQWPSTKVCYLVQGSIAPVIRGANGIDEVWELPIYKEALDQDSLCERIRHSGVDAAVLLHADWRVARAARRAGVKVRVGPRLGARFVLNLTKTKAQKRSSVAMHEADYNIELLELLGAVTHGVRATSAVVRQSVRDEMSEWLISKRWNPESSLFVVHPGMGGSALNSSAEQYALLISTLYREVQELGFGVRTPRVLVTIGPMDVGLRPALEEELEKKCRDISNSLIWYQSPDFLDHTLEHLGAIFSLAERVIAPSTGPLHLAKALGRKVAGIYSPIWVQSYLRWGPYPRNDPYDFILEPAVACPAFRRCHGEYCIHAPCMDELPMRDFVKKIVLNDCKGQTYEPQFEVPTLLGVNEPVYQSDGFGHR